MELNKNINEAIEVLGTDKSKRADEYTPITDTDFKAVMPISYAKAVKDAARWREEANEKIEERRKLALDLLEIKDEDRFKNMSEKEEKFNRGERITLSESLFSPLEREGTCCSNDGSKIMFFKVTGNDGREYCFEYIPNECGEMGSHIVLCSDDNLLADFYIDKNMDYNWKEQIQECCGSGLGEDQVNNVAEKIEGYMQLGKTAPENINTECLQEAFLLTEINSFKPWGGAVHMWNKIKAENKLDRLNQLLDELYPEGIKEQELNEFLWFDSDFLYDALELEEDR